MSKQYRISPEGRGPEPTGEEVRRYKDSARLLRNYQQAKVLLHRKPLYRDPKAFIALVILVLLAVLLSKIGDSEDPPTLPPPTVQPGSHQGCLDEPRTDGARS